MTLEVEVLGDVAELGRAIGLVQGDDFNTDWLANPSTYLSQVLTDADQRAALSEFIGQALGHVEQNTPAAGDWLPIFTSTSPNITAALVIDDSNPAHVDIGIGVVVETDDGRGRVDAHVPLFRAGAGIDLRLLGQTGADIAVSAEVTLANGPPPPGQASLGAIALNATIPTNGDAPSFGFEAKQLQLPGTDEPRDFELTIGGSSDIEDEFIELLIGLIEAQASALGTGELADFAALLGIGPNAGAIPPLPIQGLLGGDLTGLLDWLGDIFTDPAGAARAAWFGALGDLLGGTGTAGGLRLDFGTVTVEAAIAVATSAAGHVIITPSLAATVPGDDAQIRLAAHVDLATIDATAVSATALPALQLRADVGEHAGGGSTLLDTGAGAARVKVATLALGIALDSTRRPKLLIEALDVVVADTTHARLDLSSPQAIAASGSTVASAIITSALAQMGDTGTVIANLIGFTPPVGVPTVDLATLVQDPLQAVRDYWSTLLASHRAQVADVLNTVVPILAADSVIVSTVSGTGTEADPWTVPLIDPVELVAWTDATNQILIVGLAASFRVDDLGERCTVIESRLGVDLVAIDLATPSVDFLPGITGSLAARARGVSPPRAIIEFGDGFSLAADHFGVEVTWNPTDGISFAAAAPNLELTIQGSIVAIELPSVAADGTVSAGPEQWASIQALLGALAAELPTEWLADLVAAFGWSEPGEAGLTLADLIADPTAALAAWLPELLVHGEDSLAALFDLVARITAGPDGDLLSVAGTGRYEDPWRLRFDDLPAAPALGMWLTPHGARPGLAAPAELRNWGPGSPGLDPALLAAALADEAGIATDVADLILGRTQIASGIEALAERWQDSDGLVQPPPTAIAGLTVHREPTAEVDPFAAPVDPAGYIGSAPATTVHVRLSAAGDLPPGWGDVDPTRIVDLSTAGVGVEALTLPSPAAGDWFVLLAGRSDAQPTASPDPADPDGTIAQAARLQALIDTLAAVSPSLAVVGYGGAGHAARLAAQNDTAVDHLVTVATPWSPLDLDALVVGPSADSLRLLRSLLPAPSADGDDRDLALIRQLAGTVTSLGATSNDLRPSTAISAAPRAGLDAHAVFATLDRGAIDRALTAAVAAGLATRAMFRFDASADEATGADFGVLIGIGDDPGTGDLILDATARVDLGGVSLESTGPAFALRPRLRASLALQARDGWLVGGPDPAQDHDLELRAISAEVDIALDGSGESNASIVLHDPTVAGVHRARWELGISESRFGPDVTVTTALPEAGQILAAVAQRLAGATGARSAALRDLLAAIGLIDSEGGFVIDAVDHLLHDPRALVAEAVAELAGRNEIAAAAATLMGATIDAEGRIAQSLGRVELLVDLDAGQVELSAASDPAAAGPFEWSIAVGVDTTGTYAIAAAIGTGTPGFASLALRVTATGSGIAPAVAGFSLGSVAAAAATAGPELSVTAELTLPGAEPIPIELWPTFAGPDLGALAIDLVPTVAAQLGLGLLRRFDPSVEPIIDAALDAVGLLTDPDADGDRHLRSPLGLVRDPIAWLRRNSALGDGSGFGATALSSLFDALKPLLGLSGAPGTIEIAAGVAVSVGAEGSSPRLGLAIDTSAFAIIGDGSAARLSAEVAVGLALPAGGAPELDFGAAIHVGDPAGDRAALRVIIDGGVTARIERTGGSIIELYPNPAGLVGAVLADADLIIARLLDEIVDASGSPALDTIGDAVAAVGDAMGLRSTSGNPGVTRFDRDELSAWAADPAASLEAALTSLAAAGLNALAPVIDDLLGPIAVTSTPTSLAIALDSLTVTVATGATPSLSVEIDKSGIDIIDTIEARIRVDATGVAEAALALGPATIDLGSAELHPFVRAFGGTGVAGGVRVEVGFTDDPGTRVGLALTPTLAAGAAGIVARFVVDPVTFSLIAVTDGTESTAALDLAEASITLLSDLLFGYVIDLPEVDAILDRGVGNTTVRGLLQNVVLDGTGTGLSPGLLDETLLLDRVQAFAANLAGAGPTLALPGGLTLSTTNSGGVLGLRLDIIDRFEIPSGDLALWLDTDASWIEASPAPGLEVGLVKITGAIEFRPTLAANGIGIGIGRTSGPLLEGAVSLDAVRIHGFGAIGDTDAGGARVRLENLAVALGGASGDNSVAQGVLSDTQSGDEQLAPGFSPAVAVQKHGDGPVMVSLSAGDPPGPWWLAIQRGFGPVYVEQVGFGAVVEENQLQSISLYLDGRVSMFGLAAAVDDLQLTYLIADGSIFELDNWRVDLAGFAISADLSGLSLAGGLRKFTNDDTIEYVGMLLARFATYGISIFGGYGSTTRADGSEFASFFAFGAVNGPIGGPPCFFITGIGGGFGINRSLVVPTDLSQFDTYPLIAALDPASPPPSDPMAAIEEIRDTFPVADGQFWFAAGISFTSFALVDAVAVVGVEIGDGLDISILGLARMALPRPQVPLVSIELALVARFSSSEGVLWIQAQLTDNSWLLHESVRLTGGFAFVTWFKGPNKGQFVLTLGGYHPNFRADGYPVVPRLGFNWQPVSNITIKGENYFALTSEAVMAGGALEASARFGPAWAEVRFEANAIIYFDPFRYEADASARISAGITIDVWIGEITIKVSLSARIEVAGPEFHGKVKFDVGPKTLTVAFGNDNPAPAPVLPWGDFVAKYLEEASPGVARVVTMLAGRGAIAPGVTGAAANDSEVADGTSTRPFEVGPEFELTLTFTVPITEVVYGSSTRSIPAPSAAIGIAPHGKASTAVELTLDLDGPDPITDLSFRALDDGAFPVGVWGPPQSNDNKSIPSGEVIEAVNGAVLESHATLGRSLPEIAYEQVETGDRLPLPFAVSAENRPLTSSAGRDLAAQVPTVDTVADAFAEAAAWLARGGRSATALAALGGDSAAPPRLSSLGEDLFARRSDPRSPGRPAQAREPNRPQVELRPPVAVSLFSVPSVGGVTPLVTTVKNPDLVRVAAPTLAAATLAVSQQSAARLSVAPLGTELAQGIRPRTRSVNARSTSARRRGSPPAATARLRAMTSGLGRSRGRARSGSEMLAPGEVVVFDLPDSRRDTGRSSRPTLTHSGDGVRTIVLAAGGEVLVDSRADKVEIPLGADLVVVANLGSAAGAGPAGWHLAQSLPYLGWGSLLANRCVMTARTAGAKARPSGWVPAASLVSANATVTTTFAARARTVVVDVDRVAKVVDPRVTVALSGSGDGADGLPDLGAVTPIVVVNGDHTLLVYDLGEPLSDFAVTADAQAGWRVAGMSAWNQPGDQVAERLMSIPIESLIAAPERRTDTAAQLRWNGGK